MKPKREPLIYCLDATALVDIYQHYPKAMKKISRLARDGMVVIPEGVYRELCEKTDRLKNTVQTWKNKHQAVVTLDSNRLQVELVRVEKAHGAEIRIGDKLRKGFWASKKGRRAADGQVVTVSKVNGYVAVSNDQAVQDACHLENVSCVGWQEFYRRVGVGFGDQATLFDEE